MHRELEGEAFLYMVRLLFDVRVHGPRRRCGEVSVGTYEVVSKDKTSFALVVEHF